MSCEPSGCKIVFSRQAGDAADRFRRTQLRLQHLREGLSAEHDAGIAALRNRTAAAGVPAIQGGVKFLAARVHNGRSPLGVEGRLMNHCLQNRDADDRPA
jgi:hypothetical protein